jgi:hypothetical protein
MRERDRIEARTHQNEIEARKRAEREASEKPIREAEAKLKETATELAKLYRDRLLGKVRDPDCFIDPATQGMRLTEAEAEKYNNAQARLYREQNPNFYLTDALFDSIKAYIGKNNMNLVSAPMLTALIQRYDEAGLLPERPAPQPEPEPTPEPVSQPTPEVHEGYDLESGLPRTYTKREVDMMSSEIFRRVFRVYAEHLALPNIGPGPRAR